MATEAEPAAAGLELVEPCTIVLTKVEADILHRIIETRIEHGHGKAPDVRKYTIREFVLAGLCAVARAEGVL